MRIIIFRRTLVAPKCPGLKAGVLHFPHYQQLQVTALSALLELQVLLGILGLGCKVLWVITLHREVFRYYLALGLD